MKTWYVQPGDTLYQIAQSHGVSISDLLAANPGLDPNNLIVGQEVMIPDKGGTRSDSPQCPSGLFWVVEPGDTLYKISQATGFTVDEILAVNPGLDPDNLQPSTNICLPQGGLLL